MDSGDLRPWTVSGTYLEACNCEAICGCRRVAGVAGGRSDEGVCAGALSWVVTEGRAGDVDLTGLATVLVFRYDDDEPGSPWTWRLYVDERGDERHREALAAIFAGRLGGTAREHFPWAWKAGNLLGWDAAAIEIEHTPGRGWFRVRGVTTLRVRAPVAGQDPVTCVIPGHDRRGTELVAESLRVEAPPLELAVEEKCAYESTFAYAGG